MSENIVLTDEKGRRYSYENIRMQSWLDGHLRGMEAAVGWLKRKASGLFEAGRDKEAVALRNIADDMLNELGVSLKARSSAHRDIHPEIITED
jgi:hypothetical protein